MERVVPAIHGPDHAPGGPDPIPGGLAVREIKVFEELNPVVVGDKAYQFEIPEDLDESLLIKVEAYVTTPTTTGSVQVQLRRLDDGLGGGSDMLSTKITIEAGEVNSKTAATQPAVNFAQAELTHGDHIAIDVDDAGDGTAKGLGVIIVVAYLHFGTIVLEGFKGEPGGATSFEGDWATSTNYTTGQVVHSNGSSYVALSDHTSGASTEPGVGASWETVWMILASGHQFSAIECVATGIALPLGAGLLAFEPIRFPCEIVEATILSDAVGSAVVDIWKDTYANHPPTDADSITSSSPPTLANALKSTDTALAGWTTGLSDGDILAFNLDSVTPTIRRLTVSLKVRRT